MDFSTIPLLALSNETRRLMSILLNPPKVLPLENGLPRDWRGLAHVLGIPGEEIPSLESQKNYTEHILELIEGTSTKKITLKDLQEALESIERWDVIDDTECLFEKDAQQYLERMKISQLCTGVVDNNDIQMLTLDDLYRSRSGLEKQTYDAFLLYADEDFEFAKEMIGKLEQQNLRLCTKDRDLVAGVTFEHEAVMELISNRCNRLIVIISPSFFKSPANKFFLSYAQAVGIDKQQRKLIPCIYKDCQLPPQLSYTNKINYNRREFYDFWGRLCDSVRTPTTLKCKADGQISITCNSFQSVEKATIKVTPGSCDRKNELFTPKGNVCKVNGVLKIAEKTNAVEREPDSSKCVQNSSKSIVASSKLVKDETKKLDAEKNLMQTSDKQVSDSIPSLPSLRSLEDVDLLPSYSGTGKKKKSKISNIFKKIQSSLKS